MRRLLPILLAQGGTLVIGLLGVRLLSDLVDPELNGEYALFLSFAQIGVLLTHAGLVNHSSRFWQSERGNPDPYWRYLWQKSWRRFLLLAVIISAAALLYYRSSAALIAIPALLLAAISVALIEIGALGVNALEHHWRVLFLRLTASIGRTFFPLFAVVLWGATFGALVLGASLNALLGIGIAAVLFQIWRPSAPSDSKVAEWEEQLRTYGKPFLWLGIGGWLLQFAEPWAVALFHPKETVGEFNMAARLGAVPPTMVLGFLMQWAFPRIFRGGDEARTLDDWKRLARLCDKVMLLFLVGAGASVVAVHLIGPYLIGWLVDEKYAAALPMALGAGMTVVASQVNQFEYLLLQGQRNSRDMVWIMGVVSGIKTLGAVIFAWVSMEAFLLWLTISPAPIALIGRALIHHVAFTKAPAPRGASA